MMQANNPLHGKTLAHILEYLETNHGWSLMAKHVNIRCFKFDPSIKSSLAFLRKNDWARKKVEVLYIKSIENKL